MRKEPHSPQLFLNSSSGLDYALALLDEGLGESSYSNSDRNSDLNSNRNSNRDSDLNLGSDIDPIANGGFGNSYGVSQLDYSPYFDRYKDDPVGFCEHYFKESYTDDVKEVMRAVWLHRIVNAKSANATGKTHGVARLILAFFLIFPNSQVFTAAAPPLSNLELLLWGEIGKVVRRHPALFADCTIKHLSIKRNPYSFIEGVTIPQSGDPATREATFSGKHAPYLLFANDEADAIPVEVFRGIESCMSGGFARQVNMFNPRSMIGPIYTMEATKQAHVVELSAFRHPNVLSGLEIVPGAVTREVTVRRINEWTRPKEEGDMDSLPFFEVPDFLVGTIALSLSKIPYSPLSSGLRVIENPSFSYMVLGRYPAISEDQLISQEWIDRAVANYEKITGPLHSNTNNPVRGYDFYSSKKSLMGQDVAELGKDESVACFRQGSFVYPLISWGGVDPIVTAEKAAVLYKRYNAYKCKVDGTGVGAAVAPMMRRLRCNAQRIMMSSSPTEEDKAQFLEFGEFERTRDLGYWAMREWFRTDQNAAIPRDEKLIEELRTPRYQSDSGKVKITPSKDLRQELKRSADRMTSLMLTFCPDPEDAEAILGEEYYA